MVGPLDGQLYQHKASVPSGSSLGGSLGLLTYVTALAQ